MTRWREEGREGEGKAGKTSDLIVKAGRVSG